MAGFKRGRATAVVICGLVVAGVVASAALARLHDVAPAVETVPDPSTAVKAAVHGVVGPGFTITLQDGNLQNVTWLQPGTYTFTIDDTSNIHNFHLFGPGVDLQTTVPDTGTTTWTVKLTPGTYTFQCDPHATTMIGQFGVAGYGTVTTFPAPKPVVKPKPKKHKKQ
jgi:plastocyanin